MLVRTKPQKSSHQRREVQTSYARLHKWLSRPSQVAPCKQAVPSIVVVFSFPQHDSGWLFHISVNPVFTSWILPGLANTCPCPKMANPRTAQSKQCCWVVHKSIHLLWRYFQSEKVYDTSCHQSGTKCFLIRNQNSGQLLSCASALLCFKENWHTRMW